MLCRNARSLYRTIFAKIACTKLKFFSKRYCNLLPYMVRYTQWKAASGLRTLSGVPSPDARKSMRQPKPTIKSRGTGPHDNTGFILMGWALRFTPRCANFVPFPGIPGGLERAHCRYVKPTTDHGPGISILTILFVPFPAHIETRQRVPCAFV